MSRHVIFLKDIPFFFIPSTPHVDLIHIAFSMDFDSLSSQAPRTSITIPHVKLIRTNRSTGNDTLLSGTPEAPFSSTILVLRPRLWIHLYDNPYAFVSPHSYQIFLILLFFVIYFFQLLIIVSLSSLPIKRQFLILFGSKLWMRNFLLCIK